MVDAWAKCGDKIAEEMMKGIAAVQIDKETGRQKPINSVYMMSHSGARGSPAADEAARRHARPDGASGRLDHRDPDHGQLQGRPQRSRVLQLHPRRPQGSRGHGAEDRELGLPDPPSRRRGAGLDHHRRSIAAPSAASPWSRSSTPARSSRRIGQRILGRTTAEDIIDPVTGKVIVKKNVLLTEKDVDAIEAAKVQSVKIRSPLTCDLRSGCCAACYGRDLARGTPVNIGEAVGVIAAQSIGEPGTQLTMRTFHIGGTAQVVDTSFLEAGAEGKIEIRNRHVAKVGKGELVAMGRNVTHRHPRSRRQGPRHAPRDLRRQAPGRRRRDGQARPAYRRMGSLHPSGAGRSRGRGRVRGSGRRYVGR